MIEVRDQIEALERAASCRPWFFVTTSSDSDRAPVAAALARFGFDVDVGALDLSPSHAERLDIDKHVHAVDVPTTDGAGGARLRTELDAIGGTTIRVTSVDPDDIAGTVRVFDVLAIVCGLQERSQTRG
ncbi:MAG: hypothetical protein AAGI53_13060 [Planctomycetota bacterium]